MKKANKKEMELRVGDAAALLAQGHSCTVVTTQMAENYRLSRRQARRITASAIALLTEDIDEINLERPQMVAKLLVTLEQGMQKALLHNQAAGVAACAKQIINLCGLAADSSYNHRAHNRRTY